MALPVKANINGLSCRLPNSDNVMVFWENLINGVDMIGPTRWPVGISGLPPRCGHIKSVNNFDFEYFGLTEYECEMRNPILNLLLEVTYEAVLDSGMDWKTLRNTNTGYFLGCTMSDTDFVLTSQPEPLIDNTRSCLVHNVMKTFDLNGPAFYVDTACSSSISALQLAVTEMLSGRCQYAFVAGANLILNPNMSLQFHRLQMLSPTGTSSAFDISANGYVRSDGIVVMLISRSDINCPRIYSSIVDVATNCDGYKEEAVIFPSKTVQACLLRDIYDKNKIDVNDLFYVEAHGTGTQKGDLVEVTALSEVLCSKRDKPLLIGSVKSNMGHCESTAGLAGLLKCVLSMHHGVIPANINYSTTNPTLLPIVEGKVTVVSKPTDIKDQLIGLNSFGFGGANGHVILKASCKSTEEQITVPDYCLLPLRTRNMDSFSNIQKFVYNNIGSPSVLSLMNQSLLTKDCTQTFRGYCLFSVKNPDEFYSNCAEQKRQKGLWLMLEDVSMCPVQGATSMFQIPSFKESVNKSLEILKELTDGKLKEFEDFDKCDSKPVITLCLVKAVTLLIAMIDTLKASAVPVDGFLAYGLSEIALAYQDGCVDRKLCLEICLKLEEFFEVTGDIKCEEKDVYTCLVTLPSPRVYELGPQIAIHQIFPGNSYLISIPKHCQEKVLQIVHQMGGFFNNVEFPMLLYNEFMEKYQEQIIQELKPLIGQPKYMSSTAVVHSKVNTTSAPVQFSAEYIAKLLCRTISVPKLMELIPSGRTLIRLSVNQPSPLQRNTSVIPENLVDCSCDQKLFLRSLGALHMIGHDIDVGYLYSDQFPVDCKAPPLSPLAGWDHSKDLPSVEWTSYSASVKQDINWTYTIDSREDVAFKLDPLACCIYHVWKAISGRIQKGDELPRITLKNIEYCDSLFVEDMKKSVVQVLPAKMTFTVSINDCVILSGKYELSPDKDGIPRIPGYDVDVNENIFTFENDIEIEKTEIMWEDSWLYFLNELVEFAGQHFNSPLLKVHLDPVAHMHEIRKCAKVLAVSEMSTGLCKAGSVVLQFQNIGIKPMSAVMEEVHVGSNTQIGKLYLYKFNSKSVNSCDRLLVYVGENMGKNVLGLTVLSDSGKETAEISISRSWSDEDVEVFVPIVIASYLIEITDLVKSKSVMVMPPIDSVGMYLLALATSKGCDVFSSSWDSETSSLLEEIFPEANIVSGYQIYSGVKEKTNGRGCDVCFKLAGGDVNPTLDIVANDGKVVQSGLLSGEEPPIDASVFLRNIDFYIRESIDAFVSLMTKDNHAKESIIKQMDENCIAELKDFGYPESHGLLYELEEKTGFKKPLSLSTLFQFLDDPSWRLDKSDIGVTEEEWTILVKLQESMNVKPKEYSFFQGEMDDIDSSAHVNQGMMQTPYPSTHVFNMVNFRIDSVKNVSGIKYLPGSGSGSRKISFAASPWFKKSNLVASTPQILVTEVFEEKNVRKPLLSFSGLSPAQKGKFGSRLIPYSVTGHRQSYRQSTSSVSKTPLKEVDMLFVGNRSFFTPNKSVITDSENLIKPLNSVNSTEKPLFIIHPITGAVGPLKRMAQELHIPCYGIERTSSTPTNSVQSIASYYRNAIEMSYPADSYRLGGYSFGTVVALEMALQLQSASKQVECLIFIDGSPEYVKSLLQYALTQAPPGLNKLETEEYLETYCLLKFMKMFPGIKDEKITQMALQALPDLESRIELAVNITLGNILLNSNQKKTKWFLAKDKIIAKSPAPRPKLRDGVYNTAQEIIKLTRKRKAENFAIHTKILQEYVTPLSKYHGDIHLLRVKKEPEHSLQISTDYDTSSLCDGRAHIQFYNGNHDTVLVTEYGKLAEAITKIISV